MTKIKFILPLIFFTQLTHGLKLDREQFVESPITEDHFYAQLSNGLKSFETSVHEESVLTRKKKYRLDRFDLQFGLSASGDFAVLTAGGSSAVEFIWQRNLKDGDAGDDIDDEIVDAGQIEVSYDTTEKEIASAMIHQARKVVKVGNLKKRMRKRIIRKFRRDAKKIRKTVRDLVLMPRVGDWYVGGFFQNYHFKKGFSLGVVGVGYDLRVRFRFKVQSIPLLSNEPQLLTKRQLKLKKLMTQLNYMRNSSTRAGKEYVLKRVWAIHNKNFDIDLGAVNFGAGRGLQIEYKRIIKKPSIANYDRDGKYKLKLVNNFNNRFISWFERFHINDPRDKLSLHQIRMKYSGNLDLGLQLLTLGKSKTLEFHYKR